MTEVTDAKGLSGASRLPASSSNRDRTRRAALTDSSGRSDRPALAELARRSVEIILDLQDESGAYPASPNFSAYRGYCWFRDGSFIADAVSASGGVESANRFFDWCASILQNRTDTVDRIVRAAREGAPVADDQMLPTRFTLDGQDGDDDWWDFQLDGYGTFLWAVAEHSRRHALDSGRWQSAIELAVDYLVSSWSRPCFDWWEEHPDEVHVSTLGCILAGLRAVVQAGSLDAERRQSALIAASEIETSIRERGITDGSLAKWLGSSDLDSSSIALVSPLEVFPATEAIGGATTAAVDRVLNVDGGVHRYLGDTFFGGGQWPLLSCMLGLALAAAGERDRALDQLRWAASTADASGSMPEQVPDHLLAPSERQAWIDRWGPVAHPLLWSHAMYLRLAVELGVFEGAADGVGAGR